jgi:hypothetical protein
MEDVDGDGDGDGVGVGAGVGVGDRVCVGAGPGDGVGDGAVGARDGAGVFFGGAGGCPYGITSAGVVGQGTGNRRSAALPCRAASDRQIAAAIATRARARRAPG